MTRIRDHGWREADRILKKLGFKLTRTSSSHLVYEKEGLARPIIVPKYDSLPEFIVSKILATGKIGRKTYVNLLSPGKRRAKN